MEGNSTRFQVTFRRGGAYALAAFVVLGVALALSLWKTDLVPIALVAPAAALVLVSGALFRGLTAGPGARPLGALAMGALAPLIGYVADVGLDQPIHPELPSRLFSAGADRELVIAGLLLIAAAVVGPLLAFAFTGAQSRPRLGALHAAAGVAVGLSTVLVGAALLRAARFAEPRRVDEAIARLPREGELTSVREEIARATAKRLLPSVGNYLHVVSDVGAVSVHRLCMPEVAPRAADPQGSWWCRFGLSPRGRDLDPSVSSMDTYYTTHDIDEILSVHHTRSGAHWLLYAVGGTLRAAYQGNTFTKEALPLRALAEVMGPSRAALGGALIGILAAAYQLRSRRRPAARLAELEAARQGKLTADGWVEFEDGTPPERVETKTPPGPVLVLALPKREGPMYREGERGEVRLLSGTREELTATPAAEIAGRDALVILAALLTSAPLVAAAVGGLLF